MRDEIETIETTAGEVAAELARRGIDANRHVSLTVEPDDWLARGHLESDSNRVRNTPSL
jgi:hypothetical protein